MGADCCDHRDLPDPHRGNPAYRRVLWAVLAINAVMFVVEIGAGLAAGSAALQADALDFLGDAANYGISMAQRHRGPWCPELSHRAPAWPAERSEQRQEPRPTYALLSAAGRLDVKTLGLNTPDYAPEVHYHQVRDA